MHEQMKRLYEAAAKLKGIEGQSDVARALNASPQTINNWEARGMSKAGMLNAQQAFGCSANWLSTGQGAMALAPADLPQGFRPVSVALPGEENPNLINIQKVRIRVQAGITGFQVEPDRRDGGTDEVPRRWVQQHNYVPERLYAIEVHGESMEPSLYDGDTIVVNTADTKPVDGAVFVLNHGGEVVVKRLERDGPMWYLASDNPRPEFRRRLIRESETHLIGRVVRKESERI